MTRIGLVGCGQIADAHLQQIAKIAGAKVVGLCDREPALAEQAAARFDVGDTFTDLDALLRHARPDVLHITTPPQTHRPLALAAIAAGVHVYVEKPFSVDALEADEILDAARAAGVRVCVGHDQLFDPVWLEVRRAHARGELGRVVHVESIQGYTLAGPFGQVLSAEPDHWVHRLPGGLFQNTISHPLYRITEFLADEDPQVLAAWRDAQKAGYPTDLRATLWGTEVSGNLVFTTEAQFQRVARIYGTRKSVEVDLEAQTLRYSSKASLPGALGKIQTPFRYRREAARLFRRNVWRFLRSDIHYFAGLHRLLTEFYAAIRTGGPDPIPASEIRRVTAIMDSVFRACRPAPPSTVVRGTGDHNGEILVRGGGTA